MTGASASLRQTERRGLTDLFFHRSAVALNGFDSLQEGQRVSFEVEPDPRDARRQRALQVRPLGSAGLE
jgi:cold shock protein